MGDKECACVLFIFFIIIAISAAGSQEVKIKISDFPDGFLFGAGTSAYQIEGGFLKDGKSLDNWDVFSQIEGSIVDGTNANVAVDHYHRYMEDIEIMSSLGLTAYRFSISWSRILPRGTLGGVNRAGILFYNKIIDNLISRGIEPIVTMYHFNIPQEFEDRFNAWLSPLMQDEFVYLAETCFQYFGDRVRYWITMNEPGWGTKLSYETAEHPPVRCSPPFGNCTAGNSDVEPLIVMHNKLLAHAKVSKLFRDKFQDKVNGVLGISVLVFMYIPLTHSKHDIEAARRALAFEVGWPLDPLIFGDYPSELKHFLGNNLPRFSAEEKIILKKSIDFIGLNHYSTRYAKDCIHSSCPSLFNRSIEAFVQVSDERGGVPIGDPTGLSYLHVVPTGMEEVANYLKDRYDNKPIIVTENGYSPPGIEDNSYQSDMKRIRFHQSYLMHLARAIRNGADVRGYMMWSLMDCFEYLNGYSVKFGLYRIENGTLNRVPKLSARWYRRFLRQNHIMRSKDASLLVQYE